MKIFNLSRPLFSSVKPRLPFKNLQNEDINYFKSFLQPLNVITDAHDLEPFNECWRKIDIGHSSLVLLPTNTQQVSKILKYCNQKRLAVVPQGGNTGLVGGSVPVYDEIIVSTRNLNQVEKFDPVSSVITCGAGCVLEKLNQYLEPHSCQIPLDLGAKGSCQIGGNAATNAGGKYVIKNGGFRSHILGLEAVIPSGEILDMTSEIHKDNTGYDLKHLFIGSEGTLGMITKLNIHCPKVDIDRKIIVFKTDQFEKVLQSLPILRTKLGKKLNALEYVDGITYLAVQKNLGHSIMDGVLESDHMLFVETTSDDIEELLEVLPEYDDSIMSNNDTEYNKIWKVREDVAFAASKEGKVLSYDVSFNVNKWKELLEQLREELPKQIITLGYGHIGDGNLHINICTKNNEKVNEQRLFEKVTKLKGSISAEHGVGLEKSKYLHLQKSPAILSLYRGIKSMFDPNGIMSPYKVIPDEN